VTARAAEVIGAVAEPGSFEPWDEDVISWDPLSFAAEAVPYARHLAEATATTGQSDSVVTGRATVGGRAVALVAGEFGFLGGSIGVASGERIARAFERALELRLPVLAVTASGGTRMQEGTPAFLQMIKAAAAVERFRDAGLPYVAYLQDPTMGGVLASWGSRATVTFAAPGARLGFSGPRVAELVTGSPFPAEVQRAEHLLDRGLLDDVFPLEELADRFGRVLTVAVGAHSVAATLGLANPPVGAAETSAGAAVTSAGTGASRPSPASPLAGDAWSSVERSRRAGRPGARDLLARCATDVTVLRGDRAGGGDDHACLTALARVGGVPAVVVAQVGEHGSHSRMRPAGFRKARRAMDLAGELGLPLVTVVDTPAAELSAAAEEAGLSGEIAGCIAALVTLRTPTVCVLVGEGGGGGALALFPADRVVCAEHAWLSPIAPEGASAILWRSTGHAAELAQALGLASGELQRAGVVDRVVAEPPEPAEPLEAPEAAPGRVAGGADWIGSLAQAAVEELTVLVGVDEAVRLAARAERYRRVWSPPA
jgi:acetyl-CoA carboxylase carboxyl transferase beta subunit